MVKKHIITIGGMLGGGKSSTAKLVASRLGYTHHSAGDHLRQIGREHFGLNILDTNLAAEQNAELDQLVDQKLRDIGQSGGQHVLDAHMGWHFIPDSFKVYLDVDLLHAAERIIQNADATRQASEQIPGDPTGYVSALEDRVASEIRRYQKYYGVNPYDISQYDLVIDTAKFSLDYVADQIIDAYNHWLASSD